MTRAIGRDILVRLSGLVLQTCVATSLLVAGMWPEAAWARSRGLMSTSCAGCHGGSEAATVTARLEPGQVEVGGTGTLIVEVSASAIADAGLAIFSVSGGTFSVPAGQPLTVSDSWVLHNEPKPAINGKVEFRVEWTAPNEVGVALFEIAALASNGNNGVSGDKPGGVNLTVGHGCEPVTMYFDSDGDGFGREDSWIASCGDDESYVAIFGDCADSDSARNPESTEICNGLDDDCDSEVDEDVVAGVLYRDFDADGFGDPSTTTETCTPEDGYVANGDDCDDRAASNHPGGDEVCDYVDNNCDGEVDEDLRPTCGLGLCKRMSDVCESAALCSPGEPFEEVCNSLDDDCDGETDEEGCPQGQGCFNNGCVDVGAIPSASVPLSPAPPSTTSAPESSSPGVGGDTNAPASSLPVDEQDTHSDVISTGTSTSPAPNASGGQPQNTDCGIARSSGSGAFALLTLLLALLYSLRRRER